MPRKGTKDLEKVLPRHRKFVKGLIDGKSNTSAAVSAGFTSPSYGNYLAKQPVIKSLLAAEMEKQGLTEPMLVKRLKDGLDAETVPKKDGGERYDDQFVRKQFLDIIFKLRGDYAAIKTESAEKHIVIILDNRMIDSLRATDKLSKEDAETIEGEIIDEAEQDGREPARPAVVDRQLPQ